MLDLNINSFYSNVFKFSPVGTIVVREDTSLQSVNKCMFQYFDMKPIAVNGLMIGNLFRCSDIENSSLVCGHTPNCKNCGIRNALINTLNNETELTNVCINHDFIINGIKENKRFDVCGSQFPYEKEKYAILIFSDITEHKSNETLLKHKLTLDLATGVINKYTLMETINKIIKGQAKASFFTVCMIDFDYFKEINDIHGHLMGDTVLTVFSQIASNNIRNNDIIGRYGGEEFVIIFSQTKQTQALHIMDRINIELQSYFCGRIEQPVTFSAGILQVEGKIDPLIDATELIGVVDQHLYKAKELGRNR